METAAASALLADLHTPGHGLDHEIGYLGLGYPLPCELTSVLFDHVVEARVGPAGLEKDYSSVLVPADTDDIARSVLDARAGQLVESTWRRAASVAASAVSFATRWAAVSAASSTGSPTAAHAAVGEGAQDAVEDDPGGV